MKRKVVIIFCLFTLSGFSQKETNNWFFGNSVGLNFNNPRPTEITGSSMISKNGTASISDTDGNLLFYTNGLFIFDKNHSPMENGFFIASDLTTNQTSIIIPKPGNKNLYYLFTVRSSIESSPIGDSSPSGLYYSLIDISKNNGLGKVLKKNKLLNPLVSERITAIHAKDGISIWVITLGKKIKDGQFYNTFYSYKIDVNGVNDTPVKSNLDNYITNNNSNMNISPNGKYLALANLNSGAQYFNFNTETGIIDNKQFIYIGLSTHSRPKAYGVAFSQNSKFLYIEAIELPIHGGDNNIFQFQLDEFNTFTNRQSIYSSFDFPGQLQLARNGRIYKSRAENEEYNGGLKYISVINFPNKPGLEANYQNIGVRFDENTSRLGLPNFIQSYFRTRIVQEEGCVDYAILFSVDTYATITAAVWDFGDGGTSTEITPNHSYNSVGRFTATVTITINNRQITTSRVINIKPNPVVNNDQKIIQCDINNDGVDQFNLTGVEGEITGHRNTKFFYYVTLQDAIDGTNRIMEPENYTNISSTQTLYVRVYNDLDCYTIANFIIKSVFVRLGDIPEVYTCEGTKNNNGVSIGSFNLLEKKQFIRNQYNLAANITLKFYPTLNDAQTKRNELEDIFQTASTTIFVRAEKPDLSCNGIEPIFLNVNSIPVINIQPSYTICVSPNLHSAIVLNGNINNDRYQWRNSQNTIISTDRTFTLRNSGNYSLTVYKTENNIECSKTKIFSVVYPPTPIFEQVDIITEGNRKSIFVSIAGASFYSFSLNNIDFFGNSNSHMFNNVTPGIRKIYVKDINNCEPSIEKEISVLGYPSVLTPNADGVNDFWKIDGVNSTYFSKATIHIYNRFGLIMYTFKLGSVGWDGTYKGRLLQSNDYWFKAKLVDKNGIVSFKTGNFSLLRK